MLATLFPHVHRRYEASRYAVDLDAFATWLSTVGYSHDSAQGHVFRLKQMLEHARRRLGTCFTEAQLHEAFTVPDGRQIVYRGTQRTFLAFLTRTDGRLQPVFLHQQAQVDKAVRKAPFVVVPCEDLREFAADDESGEPVDYG